MKKKEKKIEEQKVERLEAVFYLANDINQTTTITSNFKEEDVVWILENIGRDAVYTIGKKHSINLRFYANVTFKTPKEESK